MLVIRVPSLAENVNEATVGAWLVAEGERVAAGQGVAELITEKAEFTLEAEAGGVVNALLAPAKSVMPVGSALCLLDATPEEIAAARVDNERRCNRHLSAPTVQLKIVAAPRPDGARVRATPAARRLAQERGVSLEEVAEAAGEVGIIRDEHVLAFIDKRG